MNCRCFGCNKIVDEMCLSKLLLTLGYCVDTKYMIEKHNCILWDSLKVQQLYFCRSSSYLISWYGHYLTLKKILHRMINFRGFLSVFEHTVRKLHVPYRIHCFIVADNWKETLRLDIMLVNERNWRILNVCNETEIINHLLLSVIFPIKFG